MLSPDPLSIVRPEAKFGLPKGRAYGSGFGFSILAFRRFRQFWQSHFRDFSHAFAYFQLTYAAWFISTSRPSRPSRKPPRKKYAQMNRTRGRKTIFTTLNPTFRSRVTMSAPSDEYRFACSIKLSSVG